MRGRLTNADTGQTIALVEGVELSRSLALETSPSSVQGRSYRHKEERAQAQSPAVAARQADDRNAGSGGRQSKRCTAAAAEGENGELEVDRMLDEKPGAWTAFGTLASSKFFMYQVIREFVHFVRSFTFVPCRRQGVSLGIFSTEIHRAPVQQCLKAAGCSLQASCGFIVPSPGKE